MNREDQNIWIETQLKSWQIQWHDLFDKDEQLKRAGEFERGASLPTDINSDYRLIFGFSRASSETRKQCLALFPQGAEMHRRFEAFRNGPPNPLPETVVRARLPELEQLITEIGPNEDVNFAKIRVINRDTKEGVAQLQNTGDITELVEGSLLEPANVERLPATAAGIFLTEPLYASAGNYYHVKDWVTAAMAGGQEDALHTILYALWNGGWQVLLDDDGIVSAQRSLP